MDGEPIDAGPAVAELCNCLDDDGDGDVDEDFDADRDHATLCGCAGEGIDCDDTDPNVHPRVILPPDEFGNDAGVLSAATERCDGKNNDCDSETDEDTCPAGDLCRQGACVAATDCAITGCAANERCEEGVCVMGRCRTDADCTTAPATSCDPGSGRCVAPRALGQPCDVDAECGSNGTCVPRSALGLPGGNRVCTQPCCSDFDCGPVDGDQICYHAPSGVRTCANATMLTGLPVPGRALAGEPCSASSDCRSSMCSPEGGCISPCVERCPELMVCNFYHDLPALGDAPGRGGMYCDVDLPSLADNFEPCADDLDCNSLFCHFNRCRAACANVADCFGDTGYCASIVAESVPGVRPVTGERARIQVCAQYPTTIADPGALYTRGVACTNNEECQSQICIDGRCTDFCCSSAECGGGRCGPKRFGDGWVVVCSVPP